MITKSTITQLKMNLNSDIITTKKPFRNRYYGHDTELSKYILKLKVLGKSFILKWSIAAYASHCLDGTRRCDLCIIEKYITARVDEERLLNRRTKFISKFRHGNKFLLKNVK